MGDTSTEDATAELDESLEAASGVDTSNLDEVVELVSQKMWDQLPDYISKQVQKESKKILDQVQKESKKNSDQLQEETKKIRRDLFIVISIIVVLFVAVGVGLMFNTNSIPQSHTGGTGGTATKHHVPTATPKPNPKPGTTPTPTSTPTTTTSPTTTTTPPPNKKRLYLTDREGGESFIRYLKTSLPECEIIVLFDPAKYVPGTAVVFARSIGSEKVDDNLPSRDQWNEWYEKTNGNAIWVTLRQYAADSKDGNLLPSGIRSGLHMNDPSKKEEASFEFRNILSRYHNDQRNGDEIARLKDLLNI